MANPQDRPDDTPEGASQPPASKPVPPPTPPAAKSVPSPPPPATDDSPATEKSAPADKKQQPPPAKKAPAKRAPAKAAKKAPAKKAAAKKAAPAKTTGKKSAGKNAEAAGPQPAEHPPGDTNGQVVAAAKEAAAQAKSTIEAADNPVSAESALQSVGRYPVPLAVAVAISLLAALLIRQLRQRGS